MQRDGTAGWDRQNKAGSALMLHASARTPADGNQAHPPSRVYPIALAKLIGDIATGQVVDAVEDGKDAGASRLWDGRALPRGLLE